MRALLVGLTFRLAAPTLGGLVFLAAVMRLPDRDGSIFDWAPRVWARLLLWAGGVRLHLHNPERIGHGSARIYVSNPVPFFDVFSLAGLLPRRQRIVTDR